VLLPSQQGRDLHPSDTGVLLSNDLPAIRLIDLSPTTIMFNSYIGFQGSTSHAKYRRFGQESPT